MNLIATLRYDQRFTRIKRNQKQIKKKKKKIQNTVILPNVIEVKICF